MNPASVALAALALLAVGCAFPQTYQASRARTLALEYDREQLQSSVLELRQRLQRELEEKIRLAQSQNALEEERVKLMEEYENLRLGTTRLRDELERERLEREMKEAELEQLTGSYQGLIDELESEVRDGDIEIQNLRGQLQVRAMEQILFASGEARLKPAGRALLERVAAEIRDIEGYNVRVEGHTDNVPISSARFPSNWELSAARATGVVRTFVGQGVDPTRLSAVGRGEFQPIDSNDTDEGRARNRRIEIILTPEGMLDRG